MTMERSIPLNLDLTCMKVETKLEDSLAIASTALNLVKSVEPSIITIQCLIAEESLDYLLFQKLPGNNFCKKFTKSTDITRQPNSCVAWKVEKENAARMLKVEGRNARCKSTCCMPVKDLATIKGDQ